MAAAPYSPSAEWRLSQVRRWRIRWMMRRGVRLAGRGLPRGRSCQSTRSSRLPLARWIHLLTMPSATPKRLATVRKEVPRRAAATIWRRLSASGFFSQWQRAKSPERCQFAAGALAGCCAPVRFAHLRFAARQGTILGHKSVHDYLSRKCSPLPVTCPLKR